MDIIRKTFGGLDRKYLMRHFIFGLAICVILYMFFTSGNRYISTGLVIFFVINTILYPYSRFVYEQIVGFIFGNNVFLVNALFLMFFKVLTMIVCWWCAIFIAPFGMAYLYYYHTKAEKELNNNNN